MGFFFIWVMIARTSIKTSKSNVIAIFSDLKMKTDAVYWCMVVWLFLCQHESDVFGHVGAGLRDRIRDKEREEYVEW